MTDAITLQVNASHAVLKLDAIPDTARSAIANIEDVLATRLLGNIVAQWPHRTGRSAKRFHKRILASGKAITAKVYGTSPITHLIEDGTKAHPILPSARQALKFLGSAGAIFAAYVAHPAVPANPVIHTQFDAMLGEIETDIADAVKQAVRAAP